MDQSTSQYKIGSWNNHIRLTICVASIHEAAYKMLRSLEICATVSRNSTAWRTEIECAVMCMEVCF